MQISPALLKALNAAHEETDGIWNLQIVPALSSMVPLGKLQTCDHEDLPDLKYVEEHQSGDQVVGVTSWQVGDVWVVAYH